MQSTAAHRLTYTALESAQVSTRSLWSLRGSRTSTLQSAKFLHDWGIDLHMLGADGSPLIMVGTRSRLILEGISSTFRVSSRFQANTVVKTTGARAS